MSSSCLKMMTSHAHYDHNNYVVIKFLGKIKISSLMKSIRIFAFTLGSQGKSWFDMNLGFAEKVSQSFSSDSMIFSIISIWSMDSSEFDSPALFNVFIAIWRLLGPGFLLWLCTVVSSWILDWCWIFKWWFSSIPSVHLPQTPCSIIWW